MRTGSILFLPVFMGTSLVITMFSTALADVINGTQNENFTRGWGYSDKVFGGFNRDIILGGDGEDYIDGGSGNDKIVGGSYSDILFGFEGSDIIFSNGENETTADGHKDTIDCGPGEDEAWINVEFDEDVVTNCEVVNKG